MTKRTEGRHTLTGAIGRVALERRNETEQVISGYAAVFYDPDNPAQTQMPLWENCYERFIRGCFDEFLESRDDCLGCFDHVERILLGRRASGTLRLSVDDVGLRYEIGYDPEDPDHRSVGRKIARGDIPGSSLTFYAIEPLWRRDGFNEIRELRKVGVEDVGPTPRPAYPGTTAEMRSLKRIREERDAMLHSSASESAPDLDGLLLEIELEQS